MALLTAILSLQRLALYDPRALGLSLQDSPVWGSQLSFPLQQNYQRVHLPPLSEARHVRMKVSMTHDGTRSDGFLRRSFACGEDRTISLASIPSSNCSGRLRKRMTSFYKRSSNRGLGTTTPTALYQQTSSQADDTYTSIEKKDEMERLLTLRLEETMEFEAKSDDASKKDSKDEPENRGDVNSPQKTTSNSTIAYHTFFYPPANVSFYGLSVSLKQFKSWLQYLKIESENENIDQDFPFDISTDEIGDYISTEQIKIKDKKTRDKLRQKWFDRQLISGRTELLANYPSDDDDDEVPTKMKKKSNTQSSKSRGGLSDLLGVYADRHASILKNEIDNPYLSIDTGTSVYSSPNVTIQSWLEQEYGLAETKSLTYEIFTSLNEAERKKRLQHFLDWFRSKFPYYWDKCEMCGSSFREDSEKKAQEIISSDTELSEETAGADDSDDDGTFLGYIYPSSIEVEGKAARTELYHCHQCGHYTRFPRYNDVSKIITYEKGRCGEYSILLYRILRSLNHHARWVVDWADHVWAECLFEGKDGNIRWVHLDPCEAAIDNPLLYQGWGKKQKMIVAFWAPLYPAGARQRRESLVVSKSMLNVSFLEDVTQMYTSDGMDEISTRRGLAVEKVGEIMALTETMHEKKLGLLEML